VSKLRQAYINELSNVILEKSYSVATSAAIQLVKDNLKEGKSDHLKAIGEAAECLSLIAIGDLERSDLYEYLQSVVDSLTTDGYQLRTLFESNEVEIYQSKKLITTAKLVSHSQYLTIVKEHTRVSDEAQLTLLYASVTDQMIPAISSAIELSKVTRLKNKKTKGRN
jgi:hypothetical protein